MRVSGLSFKGAIGKILFHFVLSLFKNLVFLFLSSFLVFSPDARKEFKQIIDFSQQKNIDAYLQAAAKVKQIYHCVLDSKSFFQSFIRFRQSFMIFFNFRRFFCEILSKFNEIRYVIWFNFFFEVMKLFWDSNKF